MISDQWVFHDVPWLVAPIRLSILLLCGVNSALMLKLFYGGHVGRMPKLAAYGMVLVLIGIAFAQARRIGETDLLLESTVMLVGLVMVLVSLLGSMHLRLFRKR